MLEILIELVYVVIPMPASGVPCLAFGVLSPYCTCVNLISFFFLQDVLDINIIISSSSS